MKKLTITSFTIIFGTIISFVLFSFISSMTPTVDNVGGNGNLALLFWVPAFSICLAVCFNMYQLTLSFARSLDRHIIVIAAYIMSLVFIVVLYWDVRSNWILIHHLSLYPHMSSQLFNNIIFNLWNLITLLIFSLYIAIINVCYTGRT